MNWKSSLSGNASTHMHCWNYIISLCVECKMEIFPTFFMLLINDFPLFFRATQLHDFWCFNCKEKMSYSKSEGRRKSAVISSFSRCLIVKNLHCLSLSASWKWNKMREWRICTWKLSFISSSFLPDFNDILLRWWMSQCCCGNLKFSSVFCFALHVCSLPVTENEISKFLCN